MYHLLQCNTGVSNTVPLLIRHVVQKSCKLKNAYLTSHLHFYLNASLEYLKSNKHFLKSFLLEKNIFKSKIFNSNCDNGITNLTSLLADRLADLNHSVTILCWTACKNMNQ